MIRTFISHSSEDTELAELLVDLLRSAINLPGEEIRCTSVGGYRLPAGVQIDEQIRQEIYEAHTFIGLISEASLKSTYVLFEMGARWGANRHLIPLLAPGAGASILREPLASLSALRCDSADELHQLVRDVAKVLGVTPEEPSVYQRNTDRILSRAVDQAIETSSPVSKAADQKVDLAVGNEFADADSVIREHCSKQWPEDFRMRSYCERKQRQALAQLKRGSPEDIPAEVFGSIRSRCATEWPRDYSTRLFCENSQVEAYRELHGQEK